MVYYNQTDARWGNKLYGKTGTIGAEGCGPTALAIVVATLVDSSVTPYDVAKWSAETGHRCEGNGSYHSLIPDGGAHYGLTVTGIGNNSTKLVEALQDGKLVIALMSKGHFTKRRTFYCPARHHRRWKNIGCRPGQRQKKQSGMGARHCSE